MVKVVAGHDDDKDDGPVSRRASAKPPSRPPTSPPSNPANKPPMVRRATPPPMARVTLPPPSGREETNAMRGATNVIARCLRVAEGERVHVITHEADAIYDTIAGAITRARAIAVRVDLAALHIDSAATASAVGAKIEPALRGATATVFLAPDRPSPAVSMGVAQTAERVGARHLHLLGVDERALATSLRADPAILATVNARLAEALTLPCTVLVTSDSGTNVELRLAHPHPILSSNGQPERGASENLPAGLVYTHPMRVTGELVVDRAIFGPGLAIDRATVRRSATRVRFAGGRVESFDAADAAIGRAIETYLASHADAGRVGIVVLPTNYLVRSEVGIDRQDMLLPSVNFSLGYANATATRATYEAPVQMVLLGRKQTVEVGGRRIVDAGRLEGALVAGIDPFR